VGGKRYDTTHSCPTKDYWNFPSRFLSATVMKCDMSRVKTAAPSVLSNLAMRRTKEMIRPYPMAWPKLPPPPGGNRRQLKSDQQKHHAIENEANRRPYVQSLHATLVGEHVLTFMGQQQATRHNGQHAGKVEAFGKVIHAIGCQEIKTISILGVVGSHR